MTSGIYLLANDNVYEQLIALLNSINRNYTHSLPICIIPFDDKLKLIKEEIKNRKNIFIFNDQASLQKWDKFVTDFHQIYYNFQHESVNRKKTNIINMHRRYCAFDGIFDKFVYIDCDTLIFQPLEHILDKLEEFDFIVHDFQRLTAIRRGEVSDFGEVFSQEYESEVDLANRFHCSGFWASKRGAIATDDLDYFLKELAQGDIKIFKTWLSEQLLLNYMTLKKGLKLYNFTLDENSNHNTGVCITSPHFEEKEHILYDKGKKLTYLHYMGIKNERLQRLSDWEKLKLPFKNQALYLADKVFKWQLGDIPYKDLFLYYRFMEKYN